jgi:hypothetical protein
MPSLWDAGAADALVARVRLLTPDRAALWGRMTCHQMVIHVSEACRGYLGELTMSARPGFVRFPVVKQLVIYALPFPKNVQTAPETLVRPPGEWQTDVELLCTDIARLAGCRGRTTWPVHPFFGRLSPRAWGVLGWRHTDHHLRQFGA